MFTTAACIWSIGLVTWGLTFWALRRRMGPVTFVERQIAHAWGAGVIASISVFVVEVLRFGCERAHVGDDQVRAADGQCAVGRAHGRFMLDARGLHLVARPTVGHADVIHENGNDQN